MAKPVRFENGMFWVEGRRRVLLAGDYPYYRDSAGAWAHKLSLMAASGLEVVTAYIPWRHHLASVEGRRQRFVFSGDGHDNRDVLRFLDLAGRAGLFVIVKPGPFVHAEIQLGGLPDHVSPSVDEGRAAVMGADGEPMLSQGLALPSAISEEFLRDAGEWLVRVWSAVIRDRLYPAGPIVGVQLGNEGIYSDLSMRVQAFDYSAPATRRFRRFIAGKYQTIDAYNLVHGSRLMSFADVEPPTTWEGAARLAACLDWGEWSSRYLVEVYDAWRAMMDGMAPILLNLSPPARSEVPGGLDAWLGRVRAARRPGLAYGFTSWMGNAMVDDEALVSYAIASKRYRGPNMEENWGFLWSDRRYAEPITPVYHALVALGLGATGFNVYAACATARWGASIDLDKEFLQRTLPDPDLYDPPYCGEAPITDAGEKGRKFEVLRLLTSFLKSEGEALLGCAARSELAIAVYLRYAHVGAWCPPEDERYRGLRLPLPSSSSITALVRRCLAQGVPFQLIDLEESTDADLAAAPRIVIPGGFFMSAEVQERLAAYVERGGALVMLWESPLLDERLGSCEILQDRLFGHMLLDREQPRYVESLGERALCRPLAPPDGAEPLLRSDAGVHGYSVERGDGRAIYLDVAVSDGAARAAFAALGLGFTPPPAAPRDKEPIVAEYVDEEARVAFVFVLSRSDEGRLFRRIVGDGPLTLRLPARGCAVLKIEGGHLAGCFIKAVNEAVRDAVPVLVEYKGDTLTTDAPCDLSMVIIDGVPRFQTASHDGQINIQLRGARVEVHACTSAEDTDARAAPGN